jgi:hypothetical protein
MIPNTGEVFYPAAANQNDGVLLEGVSFATDIGSYFHPIRETDPCYLPHCGIGFFRVFLFLSFSLFFLNTGTNPSFEWAVIQCRRLALHLAFLTAKPD